MINVTVVRGKDIIKYLARITVVIILIFILARYFSRFKESKAVVQIEENRSNALISCLEETIPQAKKTKEKDEKKEEEKQNKVKSILSKELGIIDSIEKNEAKMQKLVNEDYSIVSESENVIKKEENDEINDKEAVENARKY